MGLKRGNLRSEEFEWITNRDLVDSAHLLMGQIDLDPASSAFANGLEMFICFRLANLIFGIRKANVGKQQEDYLLH